MATTTTELLVKLVADSKGFRSDLQGAGKDVDALNAKMRTVGEGLQQAGKAMTLGLTVPIAAAAAVSVKAASDLNEMASKSAAVFGESAKAIHKWAEGGAKDFGLSTRAALEAGSSFGNMFLQLGIGLPQATKMSKAMVELAADFASFHNADISEVLLAQQAAFRGEYDAVQRFVPTINAAAVEMKALELTGKAMTKELTAQDKALAAYTLIIENAGQATGDFDRTSGSLANQMRTAKAELENAAASIGSVLIPAVTAAVGVLGSFAGVISDLPTGAQYAVVAFGALVAAAGPLLMVAGSIIKNYRLVSETFSGVGRAAAAAGPMLLAFAAIFAAGAIIASYTGKMYDLAAAVKELGRASGAAQYKLFAMSVAEVALDHNMSTAAASLKVFNELASSSPGAAQRLIDTLKAGGVETDKFEQALRREIAAQKQVQSDTDAAAAALDGFGASASTAEDALKSLNDYIDAQTDSILGLEGAQLNLDRTMQDLYVTLRTNAAGSLEARAATLQAKQSIEDWGRAVFDNARLAGAEMADAKNQQIWSLGEVAARLAPGSELRVWIEQYIARLKEIPRKVDTTFNLFAAVAQDIQNRASLANNPDYAGASGAIVSRPTLALIGEAGPEMLVPLSRAPGASPLPIDGGGVGQIVIENVIVLDGEVVARNSAKHFGRAGGPRIPRRAIA